MKVECKCRIDLGTYCFYCLSASRIRIIARELRRRGNKEQSDKLFRAAMNLEMEAKGL